MCTRQELTTGTGQINRLKAPLRDGNDAERRLARQRLTLITLSELAHRHPPRDASREQAERHGEIRRLAVALHEDHRALQATRDQLAAIVDDPAPGLTA